MKTHRKTILFLLVVGVIASALVVSRRPTFTLALRMSSTAASTAQLFFNSGRGYSESESRTLQTSSRDLRNFETLQFDLPRRNVVSLRFDPLTVAGSFVLRDVTVSEGSRLIVRIAPSDLLPLNQISSHSLGVDYASFTTVPDAIDPGITIRLHSPLLLHRAVVVEDLWRLGVIWGLLAALAYFSTREIFSPFRATLDSAANLVIVFFDGVAHRASSEFLPLDGGAATFYAFCIIAFLTASLADLNGSSLAMYSLSHGRGARQTALVGSPRAARSDEWAYVTPDILNQALRKDPFAVVNSTLGNHSVSLTGNIPVRHISTLFRPQFWSFFVLPVDYGFAVYWQFKWFLLVTGVFTWLLLITRSTIWAAAGSLWYLFSPFTQWSLSWPSALAEMIGVICWAMVFICYLTVGRRRLPLLVASIGGASCAINFALCAYPPHLIPLFWLSVLFFAAWCTSHWQAIVQRQAVWERLAAVSLTVMLIAGVGVDVFLELRPAIHIIADTVYPGKRLYAGGTFHPAILGSHFLQWGETEQHIPALLGNICEGSGFLWLAPVTLLCFRRLKFTRFQKLAYFALWLIFAVLLAWLLLPFPSALADLIALNRTAGARVLPALGLANVALVALCASSFNVSKGQRFQVARNLSFAAGITVIAFLFLNAVNHQLHSFFTTGYIALAAIFISLLIGLLLNGNSRALAASLVASHVIFFGAVNPIMRGLGVITSSQLYAFVRNHPEVLSGEWIVFSDSPVNSGFVAATGCQVYTGTRYLPDVDHFPIFAANGIDTQKLDRLGFLDAHLRDASEKPQAEVLRTIIMRLDARPSDPLIRELGIRYIALDSKPPDSAVAGLVPLSNAPVDGLWLYREP